MSVFQVRLFPKGEYQKVNAASAKHAAEMQYGSELSEVGRMDQVRVLVHQMKWPRDPSPTLFYDNK